MSIAENSSGLCALSKNSTNRFSSGLDSIFPMATKKLVSSWIIDVSILAKNPMLSKFSRNSTSNSIREIVFRQSLFLVMFRIVTNTVNRLSLIFGQEILSAWDVNLRNTLDNCSRRCSSFVGEVSLFSKLTLEYYTIFTISRSIDLISLITKFS